MLCITYRWRDRCASIISKVSFLSSSLPFEVRLLTHSGTAGLLFVFFFLFFFLAYVRHFHLLFLQVFISWLSKDF
jgi:hypothetical protein